MKVDIEWLLDQIRDEKNPLLVSEDISTFIFIDCLELNIYEEYLINYESLRLQREGYTKKAYNYNPRIYDCISIFSQFLASLYLRDLKGQGTYRKWGYEAIELCKDKREHYIMKNAGSFYKNPIDENFLAIMSQVRANEKQLNFDDGPFHIETPLLSKYPIENWLLEGKTSSFDEYTVREEVLDLITDLSLR